MHVQQKYYDFIKNGQKTIEGRLAKEKYRLIKVGDEIVFENDAKEELRKKVLALYVFATFRSAFSKLDYHLAIPDAQSINDAVAVYERFYPIDEQIANNVIFIQLG
ncbi:MAG: isomerase [Patescibacteria group bacterium]|nr:MAG: isomerase [Patescibacteria group bacterium]